MASKEFYNKQLYFTSNSDCSVVFNGETVSFTQKVGEGEEEETHKVFLYEDELQLIVEYMEILKKEASELEETNDIVKKEK